MLLVALAVLIVGLGVRDSRGPAPARATSSPEPDPGAGAPQSTRSPVAPVPSTARAALRDRFHGLLRAMGSDDLAAALHAAAQAGQLDLLDDERGELTRAQEALEARVDGDIAACVALAGKGEVLAAATRLRPLHGVSAARVETALRCAPPAVEEASPAMPRGLRVRWLDDDGSIKDGEIAQTQGEDAVTLRVRDEGGYRYPTIARVRIEPCGDDPGHARAQWRAASAAGDGLLLSLWALRLRGLRG